MAVVVQFLLSGLKDNSGNPLSNGKIYTYHAGTVTPKDTFVNLALDPETNPVILDTHGRKQIYAEGSYKFVIHDELDVPLYTFDDLDYEDVVSSGGGGGPDDDPFWSLVGNAGTVDVTNFLGTTDDVPFTIRVNDLDVIRIDSGTDSASPNFTGNVVNGNTITDSDNCFLGWGADNAITNSQYSIVLGGSENYIDETDTIRSRGWNTVLGGNQNYVDVDGIGINQGLNTQNNTICGGNGNDCVSTTGSFMGGGAGNYIAADVYDSDITLDSWDDNTISGGNSNTIWIDDFGSGPRNMGIEFNTIAGGIGNEIANQAKSTIGGGDNNRITADRFSTVYAQVGNVICGGESNRVKAADYSFIGGGESNAITQGEANTIAGGYSNAITGASSDHFANAILGGDDHLITADTFDCISCGIGVGSSHQVDSSEDCWVGSGNFNVIINSLNSAIFCGEDNEIDNSGNSAILAGLDNTIAGDYSTILGGGRLKLGTKSFGFQNTPTNVTQRDLSAFSSIGFFGDVDLWIGNTDSTARKLKLFEPNAATNYSGTNYSSFESQAQSANFEYILPSTAPTVGQALKCSAVSGSRYTLAWS